KQIRLTSVPSTLLRITQMQEQLKYLQLKRGNAPISWCTVMKKLDVANYGEVQGNTEREKFFNEQVEMQKMQIVAQVQTMLFLKQLGIDPSQLGGAGGGGGGAGGGGAKQGGGRPPSGGKAPRLKQKGAQGGEPRTTVT